MTTATRTSRGCVRSGSGKRDAAAAKRGAAAAVGSPDTTYCGATGDSKYHVTKKGSLQPQGRIERERDAFVTHGRRVFVTEERKEGILVEFWLFFICLIWPSVLILRLLRQIKASWRIQRSQYLLLPTP